VTGQRFNLRSQNATNTIRAWLGHVSLNTTHVYAEHDLETKAKALAKCELTEGTIPGQHWVADASLMAFLQLVPLLRSARTTVPEP
jgi:integrase/recombinase XerD